MVISCCAYGCKERFIKGGPYTFHSFPKDEERRKLWEITICRDNFHVTKNTKICSKHFTDDCFDKERFGGTWLKPDAIPTEFDFPSHLVPKILSPVKKPKPEFHLEQFDKPKTPIVLKLEPAVEKTQEPEMKKKQEHVVEKTQEPEVKKTQEHSVEKTQEPDVETPQEPAVKNPPKSAMVKTQEPSTSKDTISNASKRPAKRAFRYVGDFTEEDMQSPAKALKLLHVAKMQSIQKQKELKILHQKNCRLEKRIASLKLMLRELKKKSLITNSASDDLDVSLSRSAAELIKRTKLDCTREKYPPELREFASTLNLCSNRAYNYVRKIFNTSLPHPSTLRKWHKSVDGSPGVTEETLAALGLEIAEASAQIDISKHY